MSGGSYAYLWEYGYNLKYGKELCWSRKVPAVESFLRSMTSLAPWSWLGIYTRHDFSPWVGHQSIGTVDFHWHVSATYAPLWIFCHAGNCSLGIVNCLTILAADVVLLEISMDTIDRRGIILQGPTPR